jgi:hypothetical protein
MVMKMLILIFRIVTPSLIGVQRFREICCYIKISEIIHSKDNLAIFLSIIKLLYFL